MSNSSEVPNMIRHLFDAAADAGAVPLGDLPEWNLSDLYPGTDAPELEADLVELETGAAAFATDYEGKLGTLDASGMLSCVQRYERLYSLGNRVMSFAYLRYSQQTTDAERAKFLSDCESRVTDATTALVFFDLEFNRLDDAHYTELFARQTQRSLDTSPRSIGAGR